MRRRSMPLCAMLLTALSTEARAADPAEDAVLTACAACHTLGPGEDGSWGPNLYGVVGRPMGAQPGYRYGSYLRAQSEVGAIWTEAALRVWLVDSKALALAAGGRTKMPAQDLSEDSIDQLLRALRASR